MNIGVTARQRQPHMPPPSSERLSNDSLTNLLEVPSPTRSTTAPACEWGVETTFAQSTVKLLFYFTAVGEVDNRRARYETRFVIFWHRRQRSRTNIRQIQTTLMKPTTRARPPARSIEVGLSSGYRDAGSDNVLSVCRRLRRTLAAGVIRHVSFLGFAERGGTAEALPGRRPSGS
jgi:hypothetical protein